ncbi:TIGR03084 family metal-binding protein [Streptomyces sp. SID13031]|uniref:TIGR03084 family metal-binding protein n=1 Tax=Streptomyces sp. SID13031 TaxID=2706046 RepID=UPI0013CA0D32|nr:TIGR03084 family metal-binding protein [Streptomyces sp. SID13031]NEA33582.1 TIGR03084 family protein [Streptomyces sp. SID13031]
MTNPTSVYDDLIADGNDIETLVAGLSQAQWDTATPAPGWTVKHQIAHLAFVANLALLSASDPEAFAAHTADAKRDFQGAIEAALAAYLELTTGVLVDKWRDERNAAAKALAAVKPTATVPWLVNPLPPSVLAAAGMMELFGHGQDIADAVGRTRELTDRIGHLAWFGFRTRDFGYHAHGLTAPTEEFHVELTGPSGVVWEFGPADATQRVTGSAADFALLVSRRRHRDDLALTAQGEEADGWLDIAQAYRGPAGPGRRPGQFARR